MLLPRSLEKIHWQEKIHFLPYKHFLIYIRCIYLQNKYLVTPYGVGKDKKSLAIVVPSEVVKTLEIDPQTIFLLLEVKGKDELQLQIIRESDLEKKESSAIKPVDDSLSPRINRMHVAEIIRGGDRL